MAAKFFFAFMCFCVTLVCFPISAQENLKGTASTSEQASTKDRKQSNATITKVATDGSVPCECKKKGITQIPCTEFWHTIDVTTRDLDSYLSYLDDKHVAPKTVQANDLVLFLDNRPLKEIKASPISHLKDDKNVSKDVFRFELEPKPENETQRAAWVQVIHQADKATNDGISVSLGWPESEPVQSNEKLSLQVKPRWRWWVYLGMALLGLLILWLVRKKGFLRDTSGDPPRDKGGNELPRPFSLARCQMIWWFYLVVTAWAYTATFLRSPLTITDTVLILTGISAATGISSMTIDKNPDTKDSKATADKGQGTEDSKITAPRSFVKFFYDLVADGKGIAVHRFQMLAWTVILGVYFVFYVLNKMVMPDFDKNLLILMGISSGTYVTAKTQE